jgi:hypothetical protein
MNGSARKLLLVTRFAVLRMLREPASTVLMFILPLLIIPILGAIFANVPHAEGSFLKGAPNIMTVVATGMIIMFQLFSGRYSMEGTRDFFLSDRKWRIVSAPCAPAVHVMGILVASTFLSMLQGSLLVAFTRIFLGVRWGNLGVVVLVLLGCSLLSQLFNLAILLTTRNYPASASISWMFAWTSAALGGLIIPLPAEKPFWRFMTTYGTPYSLAQTAVFASAGSGEHADVALCIGALLALSASFAIVVTLLGRRRLA